MASNAGSVATLTGNPQNMIVGSFSGISYGHFAAALSPVALAALVLTFALLAAMHPGEFFRAGRFTDVAQPEPYYHRPLMLKSLAVLAAMVVLFFLGFHVPGVAILGGALLLLTRRVKPQKVYFDIDWPLLVMFCGLFVVVAAIEKTVLTADTVAAIARVDLGSLPILAGVTAVLSNLVSNVPAVLVLRPFVAGLADPQKAWLAIAMAATLAGNFTLVGSVANLIVAEKARSRGVTIGFLAYFKAGAPLTLLTLAFGVLWLQWAG